jgi:hypothetical protein
MKFEHLIEINDVRIPLLKELNRRQLWEGLSKRAQEPTEFIEGLESYTVLHIEHSEEGTTLHRSLNFGTFKVIDRIELSEMRYTSTYVEKTDQYPASRMTIRIEENDQGQLYLRFIYESEESDSPHAAPMPEDGVIQELRKQAYIQSDIDTVKKIRELAEQTNPWAQAKQGQLH